MMNQAIASEAAQQAYAQGAAFGTSVRSLGATGAGSADDSPAIQKALDGGGVVIIPAGNYLIGKTLRVKSGTRLVVHPHATLTFADRAGQKWDDFLITNSDYENGNTDIEITGGIWCGNNANNPRWHDLIAPGRYGGVMINFYKVKGLVFRDAMFCEPESYYFRISRVDNFLVENISFHTRRPTANNDGIHLGGYCSHGIIRHLRGLGRSAPNDDMVALNADDALQRVECHGQENGPITDIRVHDIEASDCHTFGRLLCIDSAIERIDVDGVRGGCGICMLNMDGARGCRVQMFDPKDPKYVTGVGHVRDVRIRNVEVHKSAAVTIPLLNIQERATNLLVEDFRRDMDKDAMPAAPTLLAANIPGHQLTLEGLAPSALDQLQEQSSATIHRSAADGFPAGHTAQACLGAGQKVVLPAGGFRRLALTK